MVEGLDAGRALHLLIYAANSRGRSEPVTLDGFTLKSAERQTNSNFFRSFFFITKYKDCFKTKIYFIGNMSPIELTSLVGMLVGAIITTIVLLVIFFIAFKLKHRMSSNYTCKYLFYFSF